MKEEILRATAKIISKKGVKAASTRAICAEIGITAPTLYHYFRDKSALLESVTALAFEKHLKEMNATPKLADPKEELKRAWDAYMSFAVNSPELYSIMIDSILKGEVPKAGVLCLEDLVSKFEPFAATKRLAHKPRKSAEIYLASAQGVAILSWAIKSYTEILNHHEARDLVLDALIKEQSSPL